ncbi:MAG TPA: anti-anti-sigma factor [Syntrophaceae bacterium]|jgi:anti-anti-sigma factor|nr:STAS domain-containing protein [Smithellaceae bacterium]HBJ75661.1 anti-anti-sigma factor [Syntrophaceae bacterium]HCX00969.1 anti-anti-sigma factor [Syntrophaceae bacterium]
MDIFESKKGGWLILELKGRMDAITAPQVREKIFSVIEQGEHNKLLLDCLGLDYVSSAGLRVLFEAAFKIQDQNGKIGCYGVSANVRNIFNLSDMASEISIFNSQEEALRG